MIALLAGCTEFDWAVFNADRVDRYALDFGSVPERQIEQVTFESLDGTLLYGVWAHQDPPATPLIFFHGNAGDIDTYSAFVEYYWSWHTYDVFIVDYRGFGRSEGVPDENVLLMDGIATADYVSESTGVSPEATPWLSVSLGSSVAVHSNPAVGAKVLVLDSMFSSADDVLDASTGLDLPVGWFFGSPDYDNVAAIADVVDPVLLIHGLADDFIPPDEVLPLFDAAPEPKELWRPQGVGHAEAFRVLPEQYRLVVEDWIGRAP